MALFSSSWSLRPLSLDFISLATICFKYCFLSFSSLGVVKSFSNKIALNVVISSIIPLTSIDLSFLKSFSELTAAGLEANNLMIVLTECFICALRAWTIFRSKVSSWLPACSKGLKRPCFKDIDCLLPAELCLLSRRARTSSFSKVACEASLDLRDETCDGVGEADSLRLWSRVNLEIALW